MNPKSKQIAMGGIFSALCVALMFFTGLMPFGGVALPMAAGAMLMLIVVELGPKPAAIAYISVSILCILIVPDRQAVMIFAAFFGYYPIVKQRLERLPGRAIEYFCKLLLFNAGMALAFAVLIYVFGMAQALEGMGDFGIYAPAILFAMGNIVFVLYDFAITRFYTLYVERFRSKFLGK